MPDDYIMIEDDGWLRPMYVTSKKERKKKRRSKLTPQQQQVIEIAKKLQAEGIEDPHTIFCAGAAVGFGREEWSLLMAWWSDYRKGYGWAKWKMYEHWKEGRLR